MRRNISHITTLYSRFCIFESLLIFKKQKQSHLHIKKQISGSSFCLSSSQPVSTYGTYPSANHQAAGHHSASSSLPRSAPGTLGWPRSNKSTSSSSSLSSQQIQQRISVPPNSSQGVSNYDVSYVPYSHRVIPGLYILSLN